METKDLSSASYLGLLLPEFSDVAVLHVKNN
jgi:hypothetical protein